MLILGYIPRANQSNIFYELYSGATFSCTVNPNTKWLEGWGMKQCQSLLSEYTLSGKSIQKWVVYVLEFLEFVNIESK